MNKKITIYWRKNGTTYRMKENKHSYTLAFINTFWNQLIDDYKKILNERKHILTSFSLKTYLIDKPEWEEITKELNYTGKTRLTKQKATEKVITIYVENPNAPLCHFVCEKM